MAMIYVSCSKDSNDNPDPAKPDPEIPEDPVYVNGIVSKGEGKGDSIAITFNGDGTIATYRSGPADAPDHAYIYYPKYENGVLKSITQKKELSGSEYPYYNYTNDQSGKIVREYYVGPYAPNLQSYDSFAYNDQGKLKAIYSYDASTGKVDLDIAFVWENNNLVRVKEVFGGYGSQPVDTFYTTYKYSDKPNPFATIGAVTLIDPYVYYYFSENLPTEREFRTASNPQPISFTTYDYEFNERGYPVKRKNTQQNKNAPTDTWEDTITYQPVM
jgi:hypothetical protein